MLEFFTEAEGIVQGAYLFFTAVGVYVLYSVFFKKNSGGGKSSGSGRPTQHK